MQIEERALGTMARADKGPVAPSPALAGPLETVAEAVKAWPGIDATVHWDLNDRTRVDGIDFYYGDEELGHLHLDGSIHLATTPAFGETLVARGLARPFPYQRGWVHASVGRIGAEAGIALFRSNYDRLVAAAA